MYARLMPLSMRSREAVTNGASSLARKATAAEIFSASANRPTRRARGRRAYHRRAPLPRPAEELFVPRRALGSTGVTRVGGESPG